MKVNVVSIWNDDAEKYVDFITYSKKSQQRTFSKIIHFWLLNFSMPSKKCNIAIWPYKYSYTWKTSRSHISSNFTRSNSTITFCEDILFDCLRLHVFWEDRNSEYILELLPTILLPKHFKSDGISNWCVRRRVQKS